MKEHELDTLLSAEGAFSKSDTAFVSHVYLLKHTSGASSWSVLKCLAVNCSVLFESVQFEPCKSSLNPVQSCFNIIFIKYTNCDGQT